MSFEERKEKCEHRVGGLWTVCACRIDGKHNRICCEGACPLERKAKMEVRLTVEEVQDKGLWEQVCEMKGINEWAVNEGLIDSSDIITFNEVEAKKLGLIKEEEEE